MNKTVLVFFLVISCMLAKGQDTYSIYYVHSKKIKYNQSDFTTIQTINSRLVFNDSISFYYFFAPERKDQFRKFKTIGDKLIHHSIFYNKNTQKLYDEVSLLKRKEYLQERKFPYHNWVFTKETKEILSYKCNNAVEYSSNGDTLSVWYTTEIKKEFGPMYYFGLPGIVLGIDNYKDGGTIKAVSIDTNKVILVSPDKYIEAIKPKE